MATKKERWMVLVVMALILFVSLGHLKGAGAAEFPSKPVVMIVPYSPGGGTDLVARTCAPHLKKALGAPAVIVENKPGGAGKLALIEASRREKDGHTLFFTDYATPSLAYLSGGSAMAGLEWTDFVPLVTITNDPRAFMVRKDSPYQDMNDLVEDMRKRPNEISIAVGGGFTGSQFRVLLMKKLLDVEFNLTGYKGGGPATAALLGGHVDVFYSNLLARYPLRDKIRNIGVTFSGKHPLFPEAAPCCEQRVFKGKNISCEEMTEIQNHVIYVGRKVKEEYPDRYNMLIEAIEKMRQDPKFQEKVKKAGIDKIAAWWSAEKSEAMQKQIIEGYKKYPDILDIMREK